MISEGPRRERGSSAHVVWVVGRLGDEHDMGRTSSTLLQSIDDLVSHSRVLVVVKESGSGTAGEGKGSVSQVGP